MTDIHSIEQRSRNMAAISGKNTKPERIVRSVLHSLGYRFRLHDKKLPGKPDIVMRKHRMAIFVNGCFWHSHECKYGRVRPATRAAFWEEKRNSTIRRDREKSILLEQAGWRVNTIWECETRDVPALITRLKRIFKSK